MRIGLSLRDLLSCAYRRRAWPGVVVFVAVVLWLLVPTLRVRLQSTYAANFQSFLRVAALVVLCLAVRSASTKGDTLLGCLEEPSREKRARAQGTRV